MSERDEPRPPPRVRKRDGSEQAFDAARIARAVGSAVRAVGRQDDELVQTITARVVRHLARAHRETIPSVEEIQDRVEAALIAEGYADIARAYILYRQRRTEARETKQFIGVRDDLKLSVNALTVLQRRYLRRDDAGLVVETPGEMMRRVADAVAEAERPHGNDPEPVADQFYEILSTLEFLPNSPTLMNANTPVGQLAACFVLPVEDSLVGIFDALKTMALVHQSGGGTGFAFSRLRPKGARVRSTNGVASGPVSFMQIFDRATNTIKQGGRRRGANMGILRVDHPDIHEFITAKLDGTTLQNFNLSVAVTDAFMEALRQDGSYELISPRTGEPVDRLRAEEVFEEIVFAAWKTGDPGLIFIDEINRHNPTPAVGPIDATNPCGEQPLLPFEACNLGSINLARMMHDGQLDWDKLGRTIDLAVRFLDNIIDVNRYPLPMIEERTKANRKIGLGLMGWADALIQRGTPYGSDEALAFAEKVMPFIQQRARAASRDLAQARGTFPNFTGSRAEAENWGPMRNATVTTIAPTGTLSLIAGASSGIEPLFALCYFRRVMGGTRLLEVNSAFEQAAREQGFYSPQLISDVARTGSARGIKQIPGGMQRLFGTAMDIAPEWHVRMQAAFQKYTDNAVSKTVNLLREATTADVRKIYLLAHELKCKGITVYRYGSLRDQTLQLQARTAAETQRVVPEEFTGECRDCGV